MSFNCFRFCFTKSRKTKGKNNVFPVKVNVPEKTAETLPLEESENIRLRKMGLKSESDTGETDSVCVSQRSDLDVFRSSIAISEKGPIISIELKKDTFQSEQRNAEKANTHQKEQIPNLKILSPEKPKSDIVICLEKVSSPEITIPYTVRKNLEKAFPVLKQSGTEKKSESQSKKPNLDKVSTYTENAFSQSQQLNSEKASSDSKHPNAVLEAEETEREYPFLNATVHSLDPVKSPPSNSISESINRNKNIMPPRYISRIHDYRNITAIISDDISFKQAWEQLRKSAHNQNIVTFVEHNKLSTACQVWRNFGNVFRYASTMSAAGSILLCSKPFEKPCLSKSLAISSVVMSGIYWSLWKSNIFYRYYPIAETISKYFRKRRENKISELFVADLKRSNYDGSLEMFLSSLALFSSFNCIESCPSDQAGGFSYNLVPKLKNFYTSAKNVISRKPKVKAVAPFKAKVKNLAPFKAKVKDVAPFKSNVKDVAPFKANVKDVAPFKANVKDVAPFKAEAKDLSPFFNN